MPCAFYKHAVFDRRSVPATVRWAVSRARKLRAQAVAGAGMSGVPLAAIVAYLMKVPLLAVRQEGTYSHDSYSVVNSVLGAKPYRYVIVDDFVGAGITVDRIIAEVKKAHELCTCAGLLLYDDGVPDWVREQSRWDFPIYVKGERSPLPALEPKRMPAAQGVTGTFDDLTAAVFDVAVPGEPTLPYSFSEMLTP